MEGFKKKENVDFFRDSSDKQLRKRLAIEITSVTDKSPTVKNIFEELKRRNPEIKISDYTDTQAIIDYLRKDFSNE